MELKDTIEGMLSDDYKERFKAEYNQLTIRVNKLYNIIKRYYNEDLNFTLSCNIDVLARQYSIMQEYKETLEERARIEGIDLD